MISGEVAYGIPPGGSRAQRGKDRGSGGQAGGMAGALTRASGHRGSRGPEESGGSPYNYDECDTLVEHFKFFSENIGEKLEMLNQ